MFACQIIKQHGTEDIEQHRYLCGKNGRCGIASVLQAMRVHKRSTYPCPNVLTSFSANF